MQNSKWAWHTKLPARLAVVQLLPKQRSPVFYTQVRADVVCYFTSTVSRVNVALK